MQERETKRYKQTLSAHRGSTHAVRNVQTEHMHDREGNVRVAETFCGRKRVVQPGGVRVRKRGRSHKNDPNIIAGLVDCQSCLKAIAAADQ